MNAVADPNLFIIALSALGFRMKSDKAPSLIAISFLIVVLALASFVFPRLSWRAGLPWFGLGSHVRNRVRPGFP